MDKLERLDILIKPASGLCNLRCKYCFYNDLGSLRESNNSCIMSDNTLETLVKEACTCGAREISFAFQGGEPLLAGLKYFEKFICYEKKYIRPGTIIDHSIQTNGTLINAEWAEFFHKHNFLVGVSLDGPSEIHNANRVNAEGKNTFNNVTRAIQILDNLKVDFNILTVVTRQTARKTEAIYKYFKKQGFRFLQFIPCLDPIGEERGGQNFSLLPKDYENFLKTLFDLWYADFMEGNYISIRLFDDYVRVLRKQPTSTCATSGSCGSYFVVESDGSIYPCDFFVLEKWCMGKIGDQTFLQLKENSIGKKFIEESYSLPYNCEGCKYFELCKSGCKRDWFVSGTILNNYYCEAFKGFWEYAGGRLKQVEQISSRFQE